MTDSRARLAVFASGAGSNLEAIHEHLRSLKTASPAELALVLSDRVASGSLERARAAGVPAEWLSRERSEQMMSLLRNHGITHIALAGYLRLVPTEVVQAYRGRILNVHPALLPAFGGPGMYGRRVHEAVLRSGARITGPTVHFVDERYDEGAIVAQWPVPVRDLDTPDTLAARVLKVEHSLYPLTVAAVCAGSISLGEDGRAQGVPPFDFDFFTSESRRNPFAG